MAIGRDCTERQVRALLADGRRPGSRRAATGWYRPSASPASCCCPVKSLSVGIVPVVVRVAPKRIELYVGRALSRAKSMSRSRTAPSFQITSVSESSEPERSLSASRASFRAMGFGSFVATAIIISNRELALPFFNNRAAKTIAHERTVPEESQWTPAMKSVASLTYRSPDHSDARRNPAMTAPLSSDDLTNSTRHLAAWSLEFACRRIDTRNPLST